MGWPYYQLSDLFVSSAISPDNNAFPPYTVIEADSLLETEVETLAEALESANNAVLSTISMISIMMSVSLKSLIFCVCIQRITFYCFNPIILEYQGLNQTFRSLINAQIMEVHPDELGQVTS